MGMPPRSDTEASGSGTSHLIRLAVVSSGAFLAPFDGSAVAVALPSISDSLHLDYSQALWVQTLYLVVVACLLMPLGRSADRRGRTSHYAAGLGLFCVGSLFAGFAPGMWWLLAARCFQGLGGALIVTTSAALAVETMPPTRRGRALGVNTMCVYLGAATGPPLGGLLAVTVGWRWLFFLSAAVAALVLAALVITPAAGDRVRRAPPVTPVPVVGSLLFAVALGGILLPLTFGPVWGWGSWAVVLSLQVAGSALIMLVLHERWSARPLVEPQLYRGNRMFVTACTAALLTYVAVYAVGLLTNISLQLVEGLGAGAAGSILLVQPVMMATIAPFAGRLYDRVGSRGLTTAGALLMALGTLILAAMPQQGGWPQALVGLALVGLGLALFSTPNISAVLGSVASERLSVASAVLGTSRFVGQALSIGFLGAIAAAQLGGSGADTLTTQITATGSVSAFLAGYRWAMVAGAGVAIAAAVVSASRGRPGLPGDRRREGGRVGGG